MKKLIAMILMGTLLITMVAGCSEKDKIGDEEVVTTTTHKPIQEDANGKEKETIKHENKESEGNKVIVKTKETKGSMNNQGENSQTASNKIENLEQTMVSQESEEEFKGDNLVVINGYFAGGTKKGEWLRGEEMQDCVVGGEKYSLYDLAKKVGEGVGSQLVIHEHGYGYDINIDHTVEDYTFALTGTWNAVPRIAQPQSVDHDKYYSLMKTYLEEKELETEVNIKQNFRVDLEGDGVDEVIIALSTIDKEKMNVVLEYGQYTIVVMRKIIDGQVKTIPLFEVIGDQENPNIETGDFGLQYTSDIVGFMDFNGDGQLEVILNERYYEGSFYTVYEIDGEKVEIVLSGGFGV